MTGLVDRTTGSLNAAALAGAAADIRAAIAPGELLRDGARTGGGADAVAAQALLRHLRGTETDISPLDRRSTDAVEILARHDVRTRAVRLVPGWHRLDGPALLASDGGTPVAVLPRRSGRGYRFVDPDTGTSRRMTDATALRLVGSARTVYRPLPVGDPTRRDLTRFALAGAGADVATFVFAGLVFGVLSLAVPMSIGTVIPKLLAAGSTQLWWIGALLAVTVATAGLMLYVRNAVAIRLQSRLQTQLEPAIWDRMLRHEVGFFQQFTTGEVVQRGNAIAQVRGALSDVVVGAVVGTVFSLTSLVVVVAVSPVLGLTLVTVLLVVIAVLALLTRRQERHESRVQEAYGEVYGMLYAVLLGIDKIQAAGREIQALARWASVFRRQKESDALALREQSVAVAVAAAVQPLLIAALLLTVTLFHPNLSVTDLVVATVASGQVAMALGQLSQVASTAYAVTPALRRLAPIVAEPVRVCGTRDPGTLHGAVTLDSVTFGYPGATDPTLDSVSLHADPGEMVAVVGPSGAGKSTVVRLLLGFEMPAAGEIRYDEQRLQDLDLRLVRRRLGTVLQGGKLLRGTIRDNIVGPLHDVDTDDVWRAAELAGIAADLHAMPMGLHTRVAETGSGFSGGQIQRLLLARALIRRPAVLLLDEATSALDNRTQLEVSERIAALSCTRIVVAHRLSTVRTADRIVVLERGRVSATGTHDELIDGSALFRRLVGIDTTHDTRGELR